MQVPIELDDAIAERIRAAGLKPVAFRYTKEGEVVLSGGVIMKWNGEFSSPRLILAPLYTPDEWLPKGSWLYRCGGPTSKWYVSDSEPVAYREGHTRRGAKVVIEANNLAALYRQKFTPPDPDSGITKFQIQ